MKNLITVLAIAALMTSCGKSHESALIKDLSWTTIGGSEVELNDVDIIEMNLFNSYSVDSCYAEGLKIQLQTNTLAAEEASEMFGVDFDDEWFKKAELSKHSVFAYYIKYSFYNPITKGKNIKNTKLAVAVSEDGSLYTTSSFYCK